jgi:hypothetical protein
MINNLWATPFLITKSDTESRELFVDYLLQEYDIFNPLPESSKNNILQDKSNEVQKFIKKAIKPAFEQFLNLSLDLSFSDWNGYKMQGWLTGSGKNYSMPHHNHAGSQISAVFYLLSDVIDDLEKGGKILFTDPRQNANRGYDRSFVKWFKPLEFSPKTGDVVVFPSYLYHHVQTYNSNIRLALPVDLFLFNSQ